MTPTVLCVLRKKIRHWHEPAGGGHQIEHIESGPDLDCDDDQRGVAIFDQIPWGISYQEITAPAGWKLDDTVYTATVVAGETTTIPIINEELPGLRIIKYDRKIWSPCPMSPSPSIGTANF